MLCGDICEIKDKRYNEFIKDKQKYLSYKEIKKKDKKLTELRECIFVQWKLLSCNDKMICRCEGVNDNVFLINMDSYFFLNEERKAKQLAKLISF